MKVASQKGLCVEKLAIDLFGVDEDPSIAPLSLCTMEEAKCLLAAAIWLMHKIDWATCRKLSQEIVEEAQRLYLQKWFILLCQEPKNFLHC